MNQTRLTHRKSDRPAPIGGAFGSPLQVAVTSAGGGPVATGTPVLFSLLSSGASGTFAGGTMHAIGFTGVGGVASSPTIMANGVAGTWQAIATVAGSPIPAVFTLTNTFGTVRTIEIVSGSPQSATVSTPFTVPVVLRAQDAGGNPLAGIDISLTSPASGAAATVLPAVVTSGIDGRAQFDVVANAIGGAYELTASAIAGAASKRLPMLNVLGPARMELGDAHSCMVTDSGTVKCWGRNVEGQLGRGATSASEIPADVAGLSGAVAVASGGYFSCALLANGSVTCWGDNTYGQVGQGSAGGIMPTASPVAGLSGIVAIAAGTEFACALDNAGAVRCWGRNHVGQTGTGAATVGANLALPTAVPELVSGVAAIAAGGGRACAVMVGGNVKCWGSNAAGSLGLGTAGGYEPSPRDVTGVSEVATIGMGGEHTCVITSAGTLKCWGNNFSGQVGVLPIGSEVHAPVDVPDLLDDLVAVHLGSSFTCVLARDGYVKCWGINDRGQLGVGAPSAARTLKVPPIGLDHGVVAIAAGFDHACARLATGGIQCWGANTEGQANGGTSDAYFPTFVGGLPGTPATLQYVSGSPQSTAVSSPFALPLRVQILDALGMPVSGVLVMFSSGGAQANAELTPGSGGGSDSSVGELTDASGYASVTARANGIAGSYVVTATISGLAGVGAAAFNLTNIGMPAAIQLILGGFQSIPAGTPFAQMVVVKVVDDGGSGLGGVSVAFGVPGSGATSTMSVASAITAANGTASVSLQANAVAGHFALRASAAGVPDLMVPMLNLPALAGQVAVGFAHSCAITQSGGVRCWGTNGGGEQGRGAIGGPYTLVATDVPSLTSGIATLSSRTSHTCALDSAGNARCWGRNDFGQVGDGTIAPAVAAPSAVGLPAGDTRSLSAGGEHACAASVTGGVVRCFGHNDEGQLGNSSLGGSFPNPIPISVSFSGIRSLASGGAHSCVTDGNGEAHCWGRNLYRQLGTSSPSPPVQTPTFVPGLARPSGYPGWTLAVVTGENHSCAIDAFGAGRVWCWGDNSYGQVGSGNLVSYTTMQQAVGIANVVALAAGRHHTCALDAGGVVTCWGANDSGQLGRGTQGAPDPTPAPANGLPSNVTAIAAGNTHTCAKLATGAAMCWGANTMGQLGTGNQIASLVPGFVLGMSGAPANIAPANGSGQSVAVNAAFTDLQAVVTDSGGNVVQGATVTFTLPATGASGTFGGQLTATAVTNAAGVATAPTLRANTTVGSWVATATVAGVAAPASFALTNLPGAPATLVAAGTPQTTLTGTLFPQTLDVTVSDAWGNTVPGVNVTFTSPPTGTSGNFPGNVRTTVVPTNASGIASTTITANGTAGTFTVQGAVAGLAPASFALTSVPRTGTTITPVSGAQTTVVGTAFAGPLVAVVKDAGNNPVPNLTVTFTLPNGTLSAAFPGNVRTAVALTDANGVATSPQPITATTRSGTFVARAAVAGVATSANFSMTNAPGVPATIAARVGGQSAAVYTTFNNAPSVRVADAYNNPVPGQNVTFALPSSGPTGTFQGQPNPVVVVTDPMGIATAPKVDANGIVGAYQATATVAPIATPATFNLTNTVGTGAKFAVEAGSPQSVVVAQPFTPFAVRVLDAADRPVEGVRVTFTLPGSAASATFPGNVHTDVRYTDATGRAATPIPTATTRSGSFTASARAAGIATVLNFALTNLPDVPATATANGVGGQTATVYQPFARAPSVRVRDQYNNGVPGVQVTFVLPATGPAGAFVDGAVSPLVVATDATGVATAPLVKANGVVGVWYVSASAAGIATPVTFRMTNVVGAGATVTSSPGTTPQSTARGTLFPARLAAKVADALGNPVQGVNVTFTLPPGAASARFGPAFTARTAVVATGPDGVATAPDAKATATAGSYMATAAAAGVTGSATFDLTNN